ncbi:polysulfide reductase NrfD [Berryella wangjianweii]|uniref:Polysulfide reductase NrfD n=1 Tax=Berryella wangjianweii TaxID=2734634 RepID=A0A6M8J9P3_9ACTN|nr:NrfD/PsrC family molybdoenzyme membrane anchor subunit [Berryella wangjianweii]QKF07532.1 polysulfide reductase NrfD [Berryella wangjianweii]
MISDLAIAYLFCGGAGAAAVALGALVGLALSRCRQHDRRVLAPTALARPLRAAHRCLQAGWCLVAFGALCLLIDLGRPERAHLLLAYPTSSLISVGSVALSLVLGLGGALALTGEVAHDYRTPLRRLLGIAVVPPALVLVVYTGVLLQWLATVALWSTPLLPALFSLSSLSAGCAVFTLTCVLVEPRVLRERVGTVVGWVEIALLTAEAVAVAAFCGWALSSSDAAASVRLLMLADGPLASWWWAGFAAAGVAAPLALCLLGRMGAARQVLSSLLAVAAVLSLVGSVTLRFSVVEAGQRPSFDDAALIRSLADDRALSLAEGVDGV